MNNFDDEKQIDNAIEHIKSQMGEELFDEWQDPFKNLPEDKTKDKKFVFLIESELVPYIEKMEPAARSKYMNAALLYKLQKDKIINRQNELAVYTKHLIIVFLTLVFGVPILFFLVNKSIELTMYSYKYAQQSFEKLYENNNNVQP